MELNGKRIVFLLPREWVLSLSTESSNSSELDYSDVPALAIATGERFMSLPIVTSNAAGPKFWLATIVKLLQRCDIDSALHARILNITAEDWLAWQQGTLKETTLDSALRGQLLGDIFYFAYAFVGSWDNVSWWINSNKGNSNFDNQRPLEMITSGSFNALAKLQHYLSTQVLSSPYY